MSKKVIIKALLDGGWGGKASHQCLSGRSGKWKVVKNEREKRKIKGRTKRKMKRTKKCLIANSNGETRDL